MIKNFYRFLLEDKAVICGCNDKMMKQMRNLDTTLAHYKNDLQSVRPLQPHAEKKELTVQKIDELRQEIECLTRRIDAGTTCVQVHPKFDKILQETGEISQKLKAAWESYSPQPTPRKSGISVAPR